MTKNFEKSNALKKPVLTMAYWEIIITFCHP